MALVILESPVAEIHGALERKGIITRQKKYRDERGRVIHEGCQEAYKVKHPRDWKKTPAQGAELAHHNRWREACLRTAQILQSVQPDGLTEQQIFHKQFNHIPDFYTPEEARALYARFHERYLAQLPGSTYRPAPDPAPPSVQPHSRRTKPDPQAPLDPATGTPKRYAQFPNFIRAMLYLELKSAE
ncbi:MAG: hypothetical protein IJT12_07800 [Paludibacteraceae bacterium]|nr:hypothetical protein [Paludibacteraceae bacterium]